MCVYVCVCREGMSAINSFKNFTFRNALPIQLKYLSHSHARTRTHTNPHTVIQRSQVGAEWDHSTTIGHPHTHTNIHQQI